LAAGGDNASLEASMADAGDFAAAANDASSDPIDRGHLRQMTFADVVLERDVLGLFDRQAASMLKLIPVAEPQALAALAHAVKGSARGIGAWRVAHAAAEVETAPQGGEPAAKQKLMAALVEARTAVAKILRGN
jgi:HPt (histidine-containing phosphotransfer) domain-containing protein